MTGGRRCLHALFSVMALIAVTGFSCKNVFAIPPGRTVVWEGGGEGRVVFDGALHKNRGFKCHDCHTRVFANMKSGSPPTRMSMKEMSEGKLCGACHNGKGAFSVNDKVNCSRCHRK